METEEQVTKYVMPCEVKAELAAKIKIDLTTSNLTQAQIALKHNTSIISVNSLNTGKMFPLVKPITETQKSRTEKKSLPIQAPVRLASTQVISNDSTPKHMEIDLNDAQEMDWFISWLYKKPGWPKVVIIPTEHKEDKAWAVELLKDRLEKIQIELAKSTLIIDALKTGDYSNLSEKMIASIEQDTGYKADELQEASKNLNDDESVPQTGEELTIKQEALS